MSYSIDSKLEHILDLDYRFLQYTIISLPFRGLIDLVFYILYMIGI